MHNAHVPQPNGSSLRRPHTMCGRLKRVHGSMTIVAVGALIAMSGCAGSSSTPSSASSGATAGSMTSGTPSGGAAQKGQKGRHGNSAPRRSTAARPGSAHRAGTAAVVKVDDALLRTVIVAKDGDRARLVQHPEFNDSRMVPTYVTLTITNVGPRPTTRPMAQIMQGFVPEEINDAEMMQVEPLSSFKPCRAEQPPAVLAPGKTYTVCRVAVSKRGHPLDKVIYRGNMGDRYYNDPLKWTM